MFLPQRAVNPVKASLKMSSRSIPMVGLLATADLLALLLAGAISVYGRLVLDGQYQPMLYGQLWPVLGVFILAYGLAGLYPGVCVSPVEELRRVVLSTTFIYLVLGSGIFLVRQGETYSRSVFLLAWLFSLLLVLLGRWLVRHLFAKCDWWGYPVLILGAGRTGELVIKTLKNQPWFGLKPMAVLDDNPAIKGQLWGIPVVGGLALAPLLARQRDIHYAIVAIPGVDRQRLLTILEDYGHSFAHLLMIPDLFGLASLWVGARDLGGILGLEISQRLLLPGSRITKALLDFSLALILAVLLLPLLLLVTILIKLDSPGPLFYGQQRLGQYGTPFVAWKFRTMVENADQVLENYLQANPVLRQQWDADHKLRYDPRVTTIGRLLRRTSLDELPQLWNVLRGEMSLVGPRPIVGDEIERYAETYRLYTRVLPGLTGLWQVSGRNNISYPARVNLDAYYVRNWSVWLDIYILVRTIWVVITGEGAY
ncbi:MAG: undecaprenyl-phosphate galactose phosphotransferase WbaP [Nodosilinea sp. LVE1205-7]|jgi:Undecaprenyl-phosphate galactose phosphotransferase WbaP